MKIIKIIESKSTTTIKEVEEFANVIGLKLPQEYTSFLLKHNGGRSTKSSVDLIQPIDEEESTIDASRFLALYDGEYSNLKNYYRTFKSRIPKKFLPIAHNSCGDLICLCLTEENYGKVYFWDHNWEVEEGEKPNYVNVYLIANSFVDFINGLYEFDIEENQNGEEIYVSIHDKHSLPTSHHIKKYGKIIMDFFDKALKGVEKFIIKEFDTNGDLLLSFKSGDKEHFRRLNKDGKIIEEYQN